MQQVFELFDKWTHRKGPKMPAIPAQPQRMLNFDFVGDEAFGDADSATEPQPFSSCLGRTESCLSASQLSDTLCLQEAGQHQSSNVVYLQRDARSADENGEIRAQQKARKYQNPKVRATAMLDASDLLQIRQGSSAAYSRFQPEQTASKQVSIEVLRRLGQRSSREELLEKIKDACDKVSAEALINSPGRRPQTGPLRQTICIQIG